jgi:hypothetical protein
MHPNGLQVLPYPNARKVKDMRTVSMFIRENLSRLKKQATNYSPRLQLLGVTLGVLPASRASYLAELALPVALPKNTCISR